MISSELMKRFFAGNCSADEADFIHHYLANHPGEIDKYINLIEWENISSSEKLSSKVSQKIFSSIKNSTYRKKVMLIKKLALAASIILLAGTIFISLNKGKPGKVKEMIAANGAHLIHTINSGRTNKIIRLKDNSVVELFPGSDLSYMDTFNRSSRNVSLIGTAIFNVTKNDTKPFTVHSQNFSTIDIGTKFKIDATEASAEQSVILYEGKVVIKLNNTDNKMKTFYLKPGEKFTYNTKNFIGKVQPFKSDNRRQEINLSKGKNVNGWYMFNDQPLPMVFKQLERIYNIHISYNENDIKDIYFVGRFENSEPIDSIITRVTKINKLGFTRNGNHYSIIKQTH